MKKNIIFIAGVLAVAVTLVLLRGQRTQTGFALVEIVGAQPLEIALNREGEYTIEGAHLQVTLQVHDGKIRFINSVCPDHLCEQFGWVQGPYDRAVCVPAGVAVQQKSK